MHHRHRIDTTPLPPEQRVLYWEEKCRDNLVSIRCSPHTDEGLLARQASVDIGRLRVACTTANAHVIERTPAMIRAFPRESIIVDMLLAGDAFVYQHGHCARLQRGDVVVFDARYPFLVGGAPSFSVLHLDIPADVFQAELARADMKRPTLLGSSNRTSRFFNGTLSRMLLELIEGPAGRLPDADALHQRVYELLAAMFAQTEGAGNLSANSASYLMAARAFIDEHLGNEGLRAEHVASAVGVSERHLRRIFALQGCTIAEYVIGRRLERAQRALSDPLSHKPSVAEVAYECGFASHAHFSRSFKQRFGIAPSEVSRRARQ